MSKVFEEAYKELAKTDVPDLWDRIEAGLSEKSAPVEIFTEQEEKKPAKIVTFMKRYATTAAALVCVAILIPAILLVGRLGIGGSKSESAACEEAAPMEMICAEGAAPVAEAAEAEFEAEVYEAAAAEAPAAEMSEAEECEEAAAVVSDTEMYEDAAVQEAVAVEEETAKGETAITESVEEAVETTEAEMVEDVAKRNEVAQAETDGEKTIYRNVKLKVIENTETERFFEGTDEEIFGYICRMKVLEDPEGLLAEGEELQIFVSSFSSIYYVEDGVFVLDLEALDAEAFEAGAVEKEAAGDDVSDAGEKRYYAVKQFHAQTEP